MSSEEIETVEEFMEDVNTVIEHDDLEHYIHAFTKMMISNIKILYGRSMNYDIKAECDRFIELLQLKTGKTKKELAKLL